MHKATLLCIAAAVAVAGTSTTADAARTRQLTKDQKAAVARIKEAQRNVVTPRTMQEAARTTVTSAKTGAKGISVPLQLDTQLGVRTDANGNIVEVVEFNGDATAVPAAGVASE